MLTQNGLEKIFKDIYTLKHLSHKKCMQMYINKELHIIDCTSTHAVIIFKREWGFFLPSCDVMTKDQITHFYDTYIKKTRR